ncbi:epoxide hydrolase [Yamadazyma tenuis ATCC 10573]|uniref:Epoxide hydrolase n=2 Tax=Candida tenuis TaxID=2315449 RepID=G3BBC1_CANTC|nr:epoxide hydrolase [Yamadazyma tenuis ATCC 10573]EGV62149.1 epoxide hydrolase [Yamadazyma tenuis ATCC 10573]
MPIVQLRSDDKSHSAIANISQAQLSYPQYSKIILLLHGFPDTNASFDEFTPKLIANLPASEKIAVVAPLLRGYERSSQTDFSRYRTVDLALDIKNFLTQNFSYTRETTTIHLVGHDWGAISCFKAVSLYPDMFDSVSTLGIPYLSNLHVWDLFLYASEQLWYSSYFLTMQWRSLYGRIDTEHTESSYLNRLWEFWSPRWNYSNHDIEQVRTMLQNNGVLDHATAYYRCLLDPRNLKSIRWKIDFEKVPVLLVGGKLDGCMTIRLYELEKKRLESTSARVEVVEGAGHFLHREAPAKVADLVADWILEHS